MTKENCTPVGRDQLTWDWNNEHVIQVGEFTLVKPAGAHNNIQVIGTPDKITIFSNGGTQDRSGQEFLVGDYNSDIQWVELCWIPKTPPVVEPEEPPVPKPNSESRQTMTEGAPDCDELTVPVTTTTEHAGYYLGDDDEWHLGSWVVTNEETSNRPATPEECPAPVVTPPPAEEEPPAQEEPPAVDPPATPEEEPEEEPDTDSEGGETPPPAEEPEGVPGEIDCPEGTVPGWLDENGNPQGCVNNQPIPGKPDTPEESEEAPSDTPEVQAEVAQPVTPVSDGLAVTGAGLEWTALIIGAVFVMAGLALYLKRPGR